MTVTAGFTFTYYDLQIACFVCDWTQECQRAFDALKAKIVSAPILKSPDFDRPFIFQTDAADWGLGAVLLQEGDVGICYPISYFSKKLLTHERSYSVPEKAPYSVVWTHQHLCPYLWGTGLFCRLTIMH